jgi:hypothetical protein
MASSMFSSTAVVTSPAQATMVAPFTGLKSSASFPVSFSGEAEDVDRFSSESLFSFGM